MQMPLDTFLSILGGSHVSDTPYSDMEDPIARQAMSETFVQFAHGLVAFVNTGRVHLGYEDTRESVVKMVSLLQPVESPEVDVEALVAMLQEIATVLNDEEPCGECDGCLEADAKKYGDEEDEGA